MPDAASSDDGLLRGFWYPALRADRVHGRRLKTAMLLGVPLVLGRDAAGRAFAVRDSCPHRGMPLSRGWFDGRHLECSYHGWKFEPVSGHCREIPSLVPDDKLDVSKIYATAFPCRQQDGYFWAYMPERGASTEPREPVPRLPTFSDRYTSTHLSAELPCHVDHGIIGLMDPAHGPFVHQAWWWRTRHSIHEKRKQFEPIPMGFRMSAHIPSTNSAPYKLLRMYAKAEGSPGKVVFSHQSHVAYADKCTACHVKFFRILQPTRQVTHAAMEKGASCGTCHNGQMAFGPTDPAACIRCHVGAGKSS